MRSGPAPTRCWPRRGKATAGRDLDLRDLLRRCATRASASWPRALADRSPGGLARRGQGRLRQGSAALCARGALRSAGFRAVRRAGPGRGPDGSLVDDFKLADTDSVHVLNAPSPAATASLAIAHRIVDQAEQTSICRRCGEPPSPPDSPPLTARRPIQPARFSLQIRGFFACPWPNRPDRSPRRRRDGLASSGWFKPTCAHAAGLGAAAQRRRSAVVRGGRSGAAHMPAGRGRLPHHRARVHGNPDFVVPRRRPVPVASGPVGSGRLAVHPPALADGHGAAARRCLLLGVQTTLRYAFAVCVAVG